MSYSIWIDLAAVVVSITVLLLARRAARKRVVVSPVSVEQAYVEQFVTEDPLVRIKRQRDEYFRIIRVIEKERDRWIEMWRTQAGEHLGAQMMLERTLGQTRQVAARAVKMLNEMRKEANLEEISSPDGLLPYDGEPVGIAEAYATRMLALRSEIEEPVNGTALRDAVAEDS